MLDILFQNADFLVVNKPTGIQMHGLNNILDIAKPLTSSNALYLVHRLDTPTSGCLVIAKNQNTASAFGKLFEAKQVSKLYVAISDKKPKKKQGKISGDMKAARNGSYMLQKTHDNPAITQFKSFSIGNKHRLFVVKPKTGKTHQIRVALKSLGAPILGDARYKGSASDRLYLHSYFLAFSLLGIDYEFSCLPQNGAFFSQVSLNACFDTHILPEQIQWPN